MHLDVTTVCYLYDGQLGWKATFIALSFNWLINLDSHPRSRGSTSSSSDCIVSILWTQTELLDLHRDWLEKISFAKFKPIETQCALFITAKSINGITSTALNALHAVGSEGIRKFYFSRQTEKHWKGTGSRSCSPLKLFLSSSLNLNKVYADNCHRGKLLVTCQSVLHDVQYWRNNEGDGGDDERWVDAKFSISKQTSVITTERCERILCIQMSTS